MPRPNPNPNGPGPAPSPSGVDSFPLSVHGEGAALPERSPGGRGSSRRGGRRPGAGAPKGNLNALKHSRFSNDTIVTGMVMLIFPEVMRFFQMFAKARLTDQRRSYQDILLAAKFVDGTLPNSIKLQSMKRLEKALAQIQMHTAVARENDQTIRQSNPAEEPAETFIPILDALADRANGTGIWAPDAFPEFD